MFKRILIANRGEIAIRIMRACREMGIETVAVYSEADERALHVRFADRAVCIGPGPATKSYLHVPAIISAAEITAAEAIHPGYGFLSENAEFARLCKKCGVTFIGPSPEAMRAWGDKVTARSNAVRFGLPLLQGSEVLSDAKHAIAEAKRVGFPVILKASGGGGGRGMRIVRSESEVESAFASARHEAEKLGVPFLGEIPLHMSIRETSDSGNPVVHSEPDGPHAAIYRAIGSKVREQLQGVIAAA